MRIVTLLSGLAVVLLAGTGIYYSPGLFNSGSAPTGDIVQHKSLENHDPFDMEKYRADIERGRTNIEGKIAYARERLKFQSLVERLPKGNPITPTRSGDKAAREFWQSMDDFLTSRQDSRVAELKKYHDNAVGYFVKSPGEGAIRGFIHYDKENNIVIEPGETTLLDVGFGSVGSPQPGPAATFPQTPSEPLIRAMPDDELYANHKFGLSSFLHPEGFGLVRDREHVSGFNSHGFRGGLYQPNYLNKIRWQIENVQLIGILQHEKPLVYLTQGLPSMEQVRLDKTRPLDYFEEAALPSLVEGDDLFIASKDKTIRMVGAIRATKVCQQCHDANSGDLLGAFSYTLRPAPIVNYR
jgi:hypothetical protein